MKFLKLAVLSLLAVFAPIKATLIVVLLLCFSDLFFGIWAAIRRGEQITSAGLRRTVTKLFVYETALLLGFLAEKYVGESMPFTSLIGGMISMVEMKSILENLNTISGRDLLKSILAKLGSSNE